MMFKRCEHDWDKRDLFCVDGNVFTTKAEYIAFMGVLKEVPCRSYAKT